MFQRLALPIAAVVLFLASCNSPGGGDRFEVSGTDFAAKEYAQDETAPPVPADNTDVEIVERKLIREGRVEFETQSLEETRRQVFAAVGKFGAYVSSDQEYRYPGRVSQTIVVRVPAGDFDAFLAEATAGVKRFDSKDINVRDVTEEFLDVEARLKARKALEARYLELLGQARTVSEMLEIERQLGDLRSEIESIEGRLKYLENRVTLSTLSLTFYETVPDRPIFGDKFKTGFRKGWTNFVWFFVFLTTIWPFIFLFVAALIGWRVLRRRRS